MVWPVVLLCVGVVTWHHQLHASARAGKQSPVHRAPTKSSRISVDAFPHALVWIDGVLRGKTACEVTLNPGKHVVEVIYDASREDRQRKRVELHIASGEYHAIIVDFRKKDVPVQIRSGSI